MMKAKVPVPTNYSRKELKRSWEDGRKSGIWEVVGWIEEHEMHIGRKYKQWVAFKKEKGL